MEALQQQIDIDSWLQSLLADILVLQNSDQITIYFPNSQEPIMSIKPEELITREELLEIYYQRQDLSSL